MTRIEGRIVAVCTSSKRGIPKHEKKSVTVGRFGLIGDWHNRQRRRKFSKPHRIVPNRRHITVISREALDDAEKQLDIKLPNGSTGDNIVVEGLGDLSKLKKDDVLKLGPLVVAVVEQNDPCINLRPLHKKLGKVLYGKRGVLCEIVLGQSEVVTAGQVAWIAESPL